MDHQQRIKAIELDAYKSLLRAFYQYQHSWKKEKLLKEIRQCFNLSHDVHDQLLEEVMQENQQPQQQTRANQAGAGDQKNVLNRPMSGSADRQTTNSGYVQNTRMSH
eukprot:TRINITY_DN3349_c0_g1_i3.p4 TRINITY_DN3349_c0_g1~~TRINITY_DN3349_c0_g1_i3.p4  ORF type:complete len:107 (-),score=9.96 TRINITY_DN3349_c0_g1_i3:669-989(-)